MLRLVVLQVFFLLPQPLPPQLLILVPVPSYLDLMLKLVFLVTFIAGLTP